MGFAYFYYSVNEPIPQGWVRTNSTHLKFFVNDVTSVLIAKQRMKSPYKTGSLGFRYALFKNAFETSSRRSRTLTKPLRCHTSSTKSEERSLAFWADHELLESMQENIGIHWQVGQISSSTDEFEGHFQDTVVLWHGLWGSCQRLYSLRGDWRARSYLGAGKKSSQTYSFWNSHE